MKLLSTLFGCHPTRRRRRGLCRFQLCMVQPNRKNAAKLLLRKKKKHIPPGVVRCAGIGIHQLQSESAVFFLHSVLGGEAT